MFAMRTSTLSNVSTGLDPPSSSVKNPVVAMLEITERETENEDIKLEGGLRISASGNSLRNRKSESYKQDFGERRSSVTMHLPEIYTTEQENNIKERGYLASKMINKDDIEFDVYQVKQTGTYKRNIFDSCYQSFNPRVRPPSFLYCLIMMVRMMNILTQRSLVP